MIDIENIVIDTVATAIEAEYPSCLVTADYTPVPESFPTVYIYEANNSAYARSFDDALTDHHVNVNYVIEVYALNKKDAKILRNIADTAMQGMKFTRTFSEPVVNIDRRVRRYLSRYSAVVGELENNTYQMYRS